MNAFEICGFFAVVALFAYLCWSLDRPNRLALAKQQAHDDERPGKGFEAASISPKIEHLRRNYISAIRSHRPFPCGRRERIATARVAVGRLSFFQHLRPDVLPSSEPLRREITED